jgi:hypothetical protein
VTNRRSFDLEEPNVTFHLLATLTAALVASAINFDITYYSYTTSKNYTITISREALANSPAWKDDQENPPLSARKAIKLANETKDSLVKDSKDYKWKLRDAALTPAGDEKWYWVIYYEAEFRGGASTGTPHFLRLVVLMDGKVVKPEVRKDEGPRQE